MEGDGVGPEVIREGRKVISAALESMDVDVQFYEIEVGCEHYRKTGFDLDPKDMDQIKKADAIYFGSIGMPNITVPYEKISMGILRRGLDLYANVRPIKLYEGVDSILKKPKKIDYVIFRENTEGLYTFGKGGFIIGDEAAVNPLIISRKGTKRIVEAAFKMAARRNGAPGDGVKRVTCVDKANVAEAYAFFRKIFDEVSEKYPDIEKEHILMDAMTVHMLQRPEHFDVVVAENMFGDILSDLGSATVGGLGLAPSMEVGDQYGLFQPIHGSAPDIAGKNIANPIAAILSGAMMFEWLGRKKNDSRALKIATKIEKAVIRVLAAGQIKTPDLGGRNKTSEIGDAIAQEVIKMI